MQCTRLRNGSVGPIIRANTDFTFNVPAFRGKLESHFTSSVAIAPARSSLSSVRPKVPIPDTEQQSELYLVARIVARRERKKEERGEERESMEP